MNTIESAVVTASRAHIMKPKTVVAVIGPRHSGKSTIIQALTGCKNGVFHGSVEDRTTGKWIEVIASSPQEKHMPDLKARMSAAANDPHCLGLVVALQPTHPRKRVSMEDVFEMARGHRAKCYAFAISQPHDENKADGVEISDVEKRLMNLGIEIPIQPLDARRFAHVNAAVIREIVGWF